MRGKTKEKRKEWKEAKKTEAIFTRKNKPCLQLVL
jgi:hypothetical protein